MRVYIWGESERYRNYRRAVEAAGGVVQFYGDPEKCGALLLPGGGDLEPWRYGQANTASHGLEPARDTAELELLDRFLTRKKPVLGICRGIQTINVFFGGTLAQDWPGHSAVSGADRYHRVRTIASPLREICGDKCIVNSAHHQILDRVGAGLRVVQWAPDGVPEAVCHAALPVWGVQWHPERLEAAVGMALMRAFLSQEEKNVKK